MWYLVSVLSSTNLDQNSTSTATLTGCRICRIEGLRDYDCSEMTRVVRHCSPEKVDVSDCFWRRGCRQFCGQLMISILPTLTSSNTRHSHLLESKRNCWSMISLSGIIQRYPSTGRHCLWLILMAKNICSCWFMSTIDVYLLITAFNPWRTVKQSGMEILWWSNGRIIPPEKESTYISRSHHPIWRLQKQALPGTHQYSYVPKSGAKIFKIIGFLKSPRKP